MAVYLDYAAATPVDPDVLQAMQPFFAEQFFNPSALYGPAVAVSKALDSARAEIAEVLGAKSSEIIFTAGGTEANNLAIHGIMRQHPDASVAVSAIEHDSVRRPAGRYDCNEIPVSNEGLVDPEAVREAVTDKTVLVSVMYANNEIGTVQPIRRIAAVLDEIRRERVAKGNSLPLYLHVDAAQAGNYLDLHVHRLGADLMTINGGKLYGPKQSGALYVASGIILQPLIDGGGQERNIRSGTENIAGAVGLAAALKKSAGMRRDETARLQAFNENFIKSLEELGKGIRVNGSRKHRLPNSVHITIPGTDNERVLIALDQAGIYAAQGSACSASHEEPSHVLKAMGRSGAEIRSSIRFSMGRQTTGKDIAEAAAALRQILA